MSTLGENIKALREARNLTQEQLGQQVGVTGVAIMRYERNQRQPKLELLGNIALKLGTTVNDLIEGNWDSLDLSIPFSDGTSKKETMLAENKKTPTASGRRQASKEEVMFALARGREAIITDAMYDEILNFADYVIQREQSKKDKE